MSAKKSWTEDGNDSDRALETETELKVAEETTPAHSGAEEAALRDVGAPVLGSGDRRLAYRLALASGRASIEVAKAGATTQLRDISATGGCLLVEDLAAFPTSSLVSATVHLADEPSFHTYLQVTRRERTRDGSAFAVGVRFADLDRASLGSVSRFMVREYIDRGCDIARLQQSPVAVRNSNRKAITRLIRSAAIDQAAHLRVFRQGVALGAEVQIVGLAGESNERMVGLVDGDPDEIAPGDELTFLLPGPSSVVLFQAPVLERRGPRLELSLPTEITQTGFRDSHRTTLSPAVSVRVSFQHPHQPGRTFERKATDLAARGLGVPFDSKHDVLFPDDRLPDLTIHLPDGSRLSADGTIRSLRRGQDGRLHCGIELTAFASEGQAQIWHRFVFHQEHPRLAPASRAGIDKVWDLYDSSSYLAKWIDSDRTTEVRNAFTSDWSDLDPEAGQLLLLNEKEGPTATVAINQSYPRTWMLHGLAVDRSRREGGDSDNFLDVARELYSAITYTLQHQSGCKYFMSYWGQDTTWNKRLCGDFAESYVGGQDQLYDFNHVWRKTTDGAATASTSGADIGPATANDIAIIAGSAKRHFPRLLVDALSLDEKELDLADFSQAAARKGLSRSRRILVARENGYPVLAAICETGGAGINIFGLMNLCWTIPMGTRPASDETYEALMAAVTRHYKAAGAPEYLLVEDMAGHADILSALGFTSVGSGVRWIARVEVLPAWLAFVEGELALHQKALSRRQSASPVQAAA